MTRAVQTALAGAKGVLQVVKVNGPASETTSSAEFTFVSASITPISTTSKILVFASAAIISNASSNTWAYMSINRNSTVYFQPNMGYGLTTGSVTQGTVSTIIYDSPATTSPVIYNLYGGKGSGGTTSITLPANSAHMVLIEIAG